MYRPVNIELNCTSNCQLNCKFCIKSTKKIPNIHMDISQFRNIVDLCVNFGIKHFELSPCVGDPLCDILLSKRIEYLDSKKGIESIYIYTNLIGLNEELISCFRKCRHDIGIYISVYGDSEQSFKEVTGKDLFHKFMRGLEILSNYPFFIDEFHMRFPEWNMKNLKFVSKPFYKILYELILSNKLKESQLIDKRVNHRWDKIIKACDIKSKERHVTERKGICHFACVDNGVFPNGDITLCHWFDIDKKMIIGNMLHQSLDFIYGPKGIWQKILKEQITGIYRSLCANCTGWTPIDPTDTVF